jgi:hypothetical protein
VTGQSSVKKRDYHAHCCVLVMTKGGRIVQYSGIAKSDVTILKAFEEIYGETDIR